MYTPVPGQILHIPGTGPAHDKQRGHFFVVLTGARENGACLLIPICSTHAKCDRTSILNIGDHHCIKRESFAMYSGMKLYAASHLESQIAKSVIELLPSTLSAKLISTVSVGIANSKFSAPVYQRFFLKLFP